MFLELKKLLFGNDAVYESVMGCNEEEGLMMMNQLKVILEVRCNKKLSEFTMQDKKSCAKLYAKYKTLEAISKRTGVTNGC